MSGSAAGGAVRIQTVGGLMLFAVAGHCAARLVHASRAAARPRRPATAWMPWVAAVGAAGSGGGQGAKPPKGGGEP
jgi:hypothetical protein